MTTVGAPAARKSPTSVWTGDEMIVWGGESGGSSTLNTGARYNPSTDTWTPMTTLNAPTARISHTATWTGTEMVVWGGDETAANVYPRTRAAAITQRPILGQPQAPLMHHLPGFIIRPYGREVELLYGVEQLIVVVHLGLMVLVASTIQLLIHGTLRL
jgi:hypothetical protein